MSKTETNWNDIPQFPKACYEIDVSWGYLESWLASQFEAGLNIDPDYQRAHVWTKAQQIAYVEHILQGGEVGKQLIFNCPNWDHLADGGEFTLVDGKQRLEAVRAFLQDKVEVFGYLKRSDFNARIPIDYTFRVRIMKLRTKADTLRLYLALNAGSTPHSQEELDKVRAMLAKEEIS